MSFFIRFFRKHTPDSLKLFYHRALARLASILYPVDQSKVKIIGVTGTDGKTTTSYFLHQIFEEAGYKVASVNSIRFKIGDKEWKNDTDNTTPGRFELMRFIKQAVTAGCQVIILEVTSWGIVQSRVRGINFDAAVLTNVTYEHLDLHKTFENYKRAKGELFVVTAQGQRKANTPKLSVVNMDDPSNEFFLQFSADKKISYGMETAATLRAHDIHTQEGEIKFNLLTPDSKLSIALKLPGLFNVYNALAAAGVAWGWGVPLEKIKSGLEKLEYVPGRLEKIDEGQPFGVIVDFAHTPNGMKQLFLTARSLYPSGKVIAVYGATGGRDPGKRPRIGEAAAQYADFSVLTTEDPRHEDPAKIAEQIAQGLKEKGSVEGEDFIFIKDRAQAIAHAVRMAKPGDVVLLCSMGCYDCMYVGDGKIPWDDRVQAHKALHQAGYKV